MEITNKKLASLLQSAAPKNASFLDKIKISYRPYICPFSDLIKLIPENTSVFDIGCGSGMFLSLIAELKKPVFLGGIEISQQLIDNAENILKKTPQISFSLDVFDGIKIPPEIKNYQYVFLIDVIHHVQKNDQYHFLKNIYDEMALGANLVVKDIDAGRIILSKFNKLHDFIFSGQSGCELSLSETKRILSDLGFKIISLNSKRIMVYPHFTIVCQK